MRIIVYESIGANINFPIIPKTINNRNAGEIEEAHKQKTESYTIEIQKSREINKKEHLFKMITIVKWKLIDKTVTVSMQNKRFQYAHIYICTI